MMKKEMLVLSTMLALGAAGARGNDAMYPPAPAAQPARKS